MRIEMKSTTAGPAGVREAGNRYTVGEEVSELEARAFLAGGAAIQVAGSTETAIDPKAKQAKPTEAERYARTVTDPKPEAPEVERRAPSKARKGKR